MRRLALSFVMVLAVMFAVSGCNGTEQAGPKVAVVDAGKVFQESAPGKAGVAHLEKASAAAQEEFKAMQAATEKDKSQESMMKMQRSLGEIQQRMNAEQQMVIGKLNDAFRKVLDDYRTAKKLDVILASEQAMSFADSADITKDIIAAMDKVTVNYEEEKAAEPEKVEAPAASEEKPAEAAAAPADGKKE